MATDWFAPVVTAAVAAMGIGFTYKAGERQAETALKVSKEQSESNLAAQREERLQRRLEDAYHELIIMLTETYRWAQSVYPMFTATVEQYTMPPMPQRADRARVEALVTAMWSPRVQQLMEPWREALDTVENAGHMIVQNERAVSRGGGAPPPHEEVQPERLLFTARGAVWEADEAIRGQVWRELRGFHDGSAAAIGGAD